MLTEHNANQVMMNAKGSAGYEADVAALAATGRHFAEHGLVGVTDLYCIPTGYDQRDLFRDAAAAGLRQSARIYYDFATLRNHPIREITEDDRSGRVAISGIKLFADGSMSNRTAWLRDPYPGTTDQYGVSTAPPEIMQEALEFARANRLQIAFHAMGDKAIESITDFYGDEEPWLDDIPSVRIEHSTLMDAGLARRAAGARMNFGVVSNIDFFFAEYDSYSQNLSTEQMERTYAVKDLYETSRPSRSPRTPPRRPGTTPTTSSCRSTRPSTGSPTTAPTSTRTRRSRCRRRCSCTPAGRASSSTSPGSAASSPVTRPPS